MTTAAAQSDPKPHPGQSADEAQPIIRLINLRKAFGKQIVLRGIDHDFPQGQTSVILGPSGCGKSVMLKHIIGLLKPDRGEVWCHETRIDTLSESKLVDVRKKIGFLFQQGALFDSMSVQENIAFPLREHTELDADQRQEIIEEVLRFVGLGKTIDKMPASLSGGQRKRVALARAIVLEPEVILYDEPSTGLDPIRSDVINELIMKLERELKVTSIVVTHDLTSAFKIADKMMMLYDGRVVMAGTPDDFRNSPDDAVQRFLRGEATADELAGIVDTDQKHPQEEPAR